MGTSRGLFQREAEGYDVIVVQSGVLAAGKAVRILQGCAEKSRKGVRVFVGVSPRGVR